MQISKQNSKQEATSIDTAQKLEDLKSLLKSYKTLAIAFSGGVDSTFLLAFAKEVLPQSVFALTAVSMTFSSEENQEALDFCKEAKIRQIQVPLSEEQMASFSHNPPNRCYLCKKIIFSRLLEAAKANGAQVLADGTNSDDLADYRPGLPALQELGIKSPLKDCALTKAEIRQWLKQHDFSLWDKPAYACLASRIPYGEKITREKLTAIDRLERELHALGFSQCRVRHHGSVARIEVLPQDRTRFLNPALMDQVATLSKNAGFAYAALDLLGYRMGNLNQITESDAAPKETTSKKL